MEEARPWSATSWHVAGATFLSRLEEVLKDLRMMVMRARGVALGSVQEAPLEG